MKKNVKIKPEDIKPDLKHDSMEYAASTDGDDILDMNLDDDDGITAEELDLLESAGPDEQANALNSTEMDRQKDNDVIFDENDTEEDYEENEEDDKINFERNNRQ